MSKKIGRQLRQAREEKELSLEQISEELFIRVPYLQALENEEFDKIPTQVQMRGFLRTYAEYLGLPTDEILGQRTQLAEETSEKAKTDSASQSARTGAGEENANTFGEIGAMLAHQREVLGLNVDDIEAHTHIPAHYIAYLENGEFDSFPSPTQARGMLANYAAFLDMDASGIMLKYADALQAKLSARQIAPAEPAEAPASPPRSRKLRVPLHLPPWVRMFFSPDTFLVSITGIVVVAFIIWGIGRITRTQAELVPLPTAPSLVDALLPSATASPTPQPGLQSTPTLELLDVNTGEEEPTAAPTIQVAGGSSIQVFIIVRQRTFLRVIVDGETAFDGRALAGESYTFNGQTQVELISGNAAALQVVLNNQDYGTLGIFGEVVDLIYTREGVITPTALPTNTLSPEELATATPEPTATPAGDDSNLPPSQNTPIP